VHHTQPSPILSGIGRALQERLEHDVHEALPERWVDLIHYLNDKERAALVTKPPRSRKDPRTARRR
jgi:hypothetical protein